MAVRFNWHTQVDFDHQVLLSDFLAHVSPKFSDALPDLDAIHRVMSIKENLFLDDCFDNSNVSAIVRHVQVICPLPEHLTEEEVALDAEQYDVLFRPLIPNSPLARKIDRLNEEGHPFLRIAILVGLTVEMFFRYIVSAVIRLGIRCYGIRSPDHAAYLEFRLDRNRNLPVQIMAAFARQHMPDLG